jgi:hypothetical protein
VIRIEADLEPASLGGRVARLLDLSARKIDRLHRTWNLDDGYPVFTVRGRYARRAWTEWTQGFFFGTPILQFAATGDVRALAVGREGTIRHMANQVSHVGVHDHGFNTVSTYGNLHKLALAGSFAADDSEVRLYELALRASGAVQAARWTALPDDLGYIYSFNGPHSLFADTMRTLRALALAHRLGQPLLGENDRRISLLDRLLSHAETTARYSVYLGTGRDIYDVRGRVAHESIFNLNDGSYRCPSSQQGYSPFTTWTRGLAWVLCGYAEQLEFLSTVPESEFGPDGTHRKEQVLGRFRDVASAVADHYLETSPTDGIPYWDTGAPGLARLGDYLQRPADPFNDEEPVDSSAAAIAAQGLLRLGAWMDVRGEARGAAARYTGAGLTVARTLFDEPYLSTSVDHQGLVLHGVYHRPNGWDHVPMGRRIPCGESTMWGDYHALELAVMIRRMERGGSWRFFGP